MQPRRVMRTVTTNGETKGNPMTMIKIPDQPEYADDGTPIPAAPAGSDLEQAFTLIEYLRARGFQSVGPIRVGNITFSVVDLRQMGESTRGAAPDRGGWAAAGYVPEQGED